MDLDEAIALLLVELRAGRLQAYGYDLYPNRGAEAAAAALHAHDQHARQVAARDMTPIFFEAAWELCRRGIVRPGVRRGGDQAVPDGGYSLTVAGLAALQNLDAAGVLLAQSGSLAATFSGYRVRFGTGFEQRALEAIRCRNAEAWLACCAMAGAAAEAILLAIAIAKTADEERVLAMYRRASGRTLVVNLIAGQAAGHVRNTLTTFSSIISLWRDEAAHGQATAIGTANADEALRQLLHMCQWVDREWQALVG